MVGVLALQGGFGMHKVILDEIGVQSIFVKNEIDLLQTDALIIPGGESTTLSILIDRFKLRASILEYSKHKSIFGTCAGMIMLSTSKKLINKVKTLDIMSFSVMRNSWGTQVYSFEKKISLKKFNIPSFNAVFIRAPKVKSIGAGILNKESIDFKKNNSSNSDKEVIILEDNRHMACSFHPEIDGDTRVHEYFLNKYYYGKE